jgi:hypothetical protein
MFILGVKGGAIVAACRGPSRRNTVGAAALGFAVAFAAGCLDYDERIVMKPDGSGVLKVHVSISDKAVAAMTDAKSRLNPKAIAKDFEGKGVGEPDIRLKKGRGTHDIFVVVEFDSLEALAGTTAFKERQIGITRLAGGRTRFSQTLSTLAGEKKKARGDSVRFPNSTRA